jgi:hypothetical protein
MFASSSDLDDLERAIDKVLASEHPPVLELPRLRRRLDRLDAAFVVTVRAAGRAGVLDEVTLSRLTLRARWGSARSGRSHLAGIRARSQHRDWP